MTRTVLTAIALATVLLWWTQAGPRPEDRPAGALPPEFGSAMHRQWRPAPRKAGDEPLSYGETLLLAYLEAGSQLDPIQRGEILRRAERSIRVGLEQSGGDLRSHPLYSQKFTLRFVQDELGATAEPVALDSVEEASYRALFRDPAFVDPAWALRLLQAARVEDAGRLAELGEVDRSSLEIVLQLASGYVNAADARRQVEAVRSLLPGHRFPGSAWAEIGYGSGKIFAPVRQLVGPRGRLVGVEVGAGQERFVRRVQERDEPGWGRVELVRGTPSDCRLPARSFDIIHAAGIHVGAGSPERRRSELLPWLRSVRKALRPAGWLILDDAGEPPLPIVREVVRTAGFGEPRVLWYEGGERQAFVAAFPSR